MHDIAAFKFVKVVSSTLIGRVWQFSLQSVQRHNQISKIGDIFEKISTVLRVPPLVDPRAVEMNIFADLTISKRQKSKKSVRNFALKISDS